MKKFILGLVLAFVCIISASAQIVDNGSSRDNWYVGGGIGTHIWDNYNSWQVFNPWKKQQLNINIFGGKYFTPYVGSELDATALFNSGAESNFIDGHLISLNGVINLSNIIAGYKGERRLFEVEALAGPGWYHAYNTGKDFNHGALHGAIRANFKLNKDLNIYVMPEYVSLIDVNDHFNMKPHGVNIYAGVKWNIPSKRGGFPVCRLYDPAEVESLNAQITNLKSKLAKKPSVKYVDKTVVEKIDNSYTIYFDKGDATVKNLSGIIEALSKTNTPITIVGGTSPEGSENFNRKLAISRAEAVKQALVNAGIDANRISIATDYSQKRLATIILGK